MRPQALAVMTLLIVGSPSMAAHATKQDSAGAVPAQTAAPALGANPGAAWFVPPFSAHYTADWRGINVGTSDLMLKTDTAPGSYLYTWTVTARGVFRLVYPNDVIQKSWFSISGIHVRPDKYRAEDGTSTATVDFDWEALRARGETEKKPIDLKLNEDTQDIMSIQVEVMLDLRNGNLPKTFHIVDKDEIKEFLYTVEGPARIRTALGELDTVIVSSRRPGNDRILRMWFAPSLNYVPVLAERSRGDRAEFTMKIKTLKAEPHPT
jgi:hypothetical protein